MDIDETESLHRDISRVVKPIPFIGIDEFFDISTILARPDLVARVITKMSRLVGQFSPTVICALDARGFIFGAPIALNLHVPLIMVRKVGKLPGMCRQCTFDKEYETGDVFEIQCNRIQLSDRVVIIDDILATGGSMKGAWDLVSQSTPAFVVGVCLLDLGLLGSQEFLSSKGVRVESVLNSSRWKEDAAD